MKEITNFPWNFTISRPAILYVLVHKSGEYQSVHYNEGPTECVHFILVIFQECFIILHCSWKSIMSVKIKFFFFFTKTNKIWTILWECEVLYKKRLSPYNTSPVKSYLVQHLFSSSEKNLESMLVTLPIIA